MGRTLGLLVAAALLSGGATQVAAQERHDGDWQEHHGHAGGHPDRGHWHGGDIHRFHEHDIEVWRAGHWWHGHHGGRAGWWWIAGGGWYFYPQPVYPFPDPYQPPFIGPPVAPAPEVAPPQTAYYWCDAPAGYYPYVARCRVPWRAVPAG